MNKSPEKGPLSSPAAPASDPLKQVDDNIRQFVEDLAKLEPVLTSIGMRRAGAPLENGKHPFVLSSTRRSVHIEMPDVPLWKVRYTGRKGQSVWSYATINVAGLEYAWSFAVEAAHVLLAEAAMTGGQKAIDSAEKEGL